MNTVEIYTKPYCPYCHRAKALLDAKGLSYTEIDVSMDKTRLSEMLHRSQRSTVPQVFIGDHHIGGSDDLIVANQNGELATLLQPGNSACRLTTELR